MEDPILKSNKRKFSETIDLVDKDGVKDVNHLLHQECDSSTKIKKNCKYGEQCYRRNPKHLREYTHPTKSFDVEMKMDRPMYYLTKVNQVQNEKYINERFSLSLADILSINEKDLVNSAQFNYMFDLDWLIKQYPASYRRDRMPFTIIYGGENKEQMERIVTDKYGQISLIKVKLPPYGTHHTKMMFLVYKTAGMRIVIHTCNLIENDWDKKTQGVWLSDIFPRKSENKSRGSSTDSKTGFKSYLIEYLKAYKESKLDEWIELINEHDMSSANVFLIGSVPIRSSLCKNFGHLRLRKILSENLNLNEYDPNNEHAKYVCHNSNKLVCQFSSIGSLGPNESSWLCKEFMISLLAHENDSCEAEKGDAIKVSSDSEDEEFHSGTSEDMKPILIYPTLRNVLNSYEGINAGYSFPYSQTVANKQQYLNNFLYQWSADSTRRTRASPHIKSYARYSRDYKKLYWFLLTSANLSKAAWGALEKKEQQFFIRSYEMGVLFLPKHFKTSKGADDVYFDLSNNEFIVPYDLPPVKYDVQNDLPWTSEMMQI